MATASCRIREAVRRWARSLKTTKHRINHVVTGGPIELEQLDSADASLAFDRLHGHRHCQFRSNRARRREPSKLGDLFPAASPRTAAVLRPVFVRVALFCQLAASEEHMKKTGAGEAQSAS